MSLFASAPLLAAMEAGTASAATMPLCGGFTGIPGGAFRMGASNLWELSAPPHEVELSPFQMGRKPVTNGEYQAWADTFGRDHYLLVFDGGNDVRELARGRSPKELSAIPIESFDSPLKAAGFDLDREGRQAFLRRRSIISVRQSELREGFDRPRQPAANVCWDSAFLFAKAHGARLPTEAEWEFAATCGGQYLYGTFSGGYSLFEAQCEKTAPADVGSYRPNQWGLFDMAGNLRQWCEDWLGIYPEGRLVNPRGPAEGRWKVLRGGCYFDGRRTLRAAARFASLPWCSELQNGIRLVREAAGQTRPEPAGPPMQPVLPPPIVMRTSEPPKKSTRWFDSTLKPAPRPASGPQIDLFTPQSPSSGYRIF